jgi:hypothetical protein
LHILISLYLILIQWYFQTCYYINILNLIFLKKNRSNEYILKYWLNSDCKISFTSSTNNILTQKLSRKILSRMQAYIRLDYMCLSKKKETGLYVEYMHFALHNKPLSFSMIFSSFNKIKPKKFSTINKNKIKPNEEHIMKFHVYIVYYWVNP